MEMIQQIAAVAGVLALLAATLWWLRRRGYRRRYRLAQKDAARRLECLERLPLGPQHTLHLVRLGDARCWFGSSPPAARWCERCRRRESRTPTGGAPMKASPAVLLVLLRRPALPALAAASRTSLPLGISAGKGGSSLSVPMQIVILLTLLTLLPAAVMSITPFLRITVVLHFLRQALGTQTAPSNQVLLGLALFLTIVIMQPVAADMYHQGWEPLEAGQITTAAGHGSGRQAAARLPGALRPRKGHPAVRRNLARARAAHARRSGS